VFVETNRVAGGGTPEARSARREAIHNSVDHTPRICSFVEKSRLRTTVRARFQHGAETGHSAHSREANLPENGTVSPWLQLPLQVKIDSSTNMKQQFRRTLFSEKIHCRCRGRAERIGNKIGWITVSVASECSVGTASRDRTIQLLKTLFKAGEA